jgi:uncharacterized membrane protein
MTRTGGELLATVRAALTLVVVGVAAMLAASVSAPQVSTESVLLIAALSAATTATLGSRLVVLPAAQPLMAPTTWAGEVLPHLAGRSTDVEHHPQRPRAPGPV